MTVAEMIAERTAALQTALGSANSAITAKGGTGDATTISGLADAIDTISTETPLPTLTNPAAAGDILLHKEAIDGQGAKLTGTLNICDSISVDEVYPPSEGVASMQVTSTKDDSTKVIAWQEPDALPENIVAGKTILGVTGTYEGGGSVTVEPLSVTENGTYTAPTGKAYSPVTVNVPTGGSNPNVFVYEVPTTTRTLTITHNLGVAPTRVVCICMDTVAPASGEKLISGVSNVGSVNGRSVYYNTSGTIDAVNNSTTTGFIISTADETSMTLTVTRNLAGGSTYLFIFA